jgi:hypothetical protein
MTSLLFVTTLPHTKTHVLLMAFFSNFNRKSNIPLYDVSPLPVLDKTV